MKVIKSQILAVTRGEYSDYTLMDHFRALKDFDTDETKAAYNVVFPEHDFLVDPDRHEKYLAWCAEQGYIEVLSENEVQEWYIGSYGDLI